MMLNIAMDNDIYIVYGSDAYSMTKALLEKVRAENLIKDRDAKIIIKPNFVIAALPESGATTHTEITEATIEYLKERGFENITVAEGSWVGSRTEDAFRLLGYYEFEKRYGVKLLDTKKDKYRTIKSHGIAMEVSDVVLDADFIINLPVLKGHCQTLMTHSMKNLKGFLSDRSKRDFHRLGLSEPIAALADAIRPGLILSDSISGDLDFEEGGNPVETNRMLAATDQFLIDSFAATLMGFDPDEIEYIRIAREWGLLSTPLESASIIELNRPTASEGKPKGIAQALSRYAEPENACSACFASLIHALKRLDDENGLRHLKGKKIAIGQGYKTKKVEIGVGACCSGAAMSVKGCPPKADDVLKMLRSI